MGEYLTKETGNRIVRLVIGVSLLLMLVIFLSYYQSISDRRNPEPLTKARINAERVIQDTIDDIQARADINCIKAFPLVKKDVD